MNNTQSEQSYMSGNVQEKENNNDYSKVVLEEIPNSPFQLAYEEESGWALTCGKNRVSEWEDDPKKLLDQVKDKTWDLITVATHILVKHELDKRGILG